MNARLPASHAALPVAPATAQQDGARALLSTLVELGVDTVFGYPGGAVLPLYDALHGEPRLRHVLVRHEQAAVHAAQGYARSTGRLGVVFVTSGPGMSNTTTGLLDAQCDSVPVLCVSGQVPTHLIGTDAFQECDTTGITRTCAKHNYLVTDINQLARIMHEAFYVATTGRPGPVVIDIPKDIQFASGPYVGKEGITKPTYVPQRTPNRDAIRAAADLITKATRPIFYTGGGVINSGPAASAKLRELQELTGVPVTSTLMGLGAFPASHPDWLGMVGMHGSFEANNAMHDSDLMVCIGARFDDRVTGRVDMFAPKSKKIHIDIDPSSINKIVRVDVPVVADCAEALDALITEIKALKRKLPDLASWRDQIDTWRARRCFSYANSGEVIKPQYAIERLYALTKDRKTFITTEVGQHQMWAAQFYHFDEPNRWMTSGGLGTMGYGLPAAVGVQCAHPDSLVVDIAGEASIQMMMQELSTAVQHKLPVKVFILNNEWMGMVRQWQQLIHGGRYSHSYTAALPDFVAVARGFGWQARRVTDRGELDAALAQCLDSDTPYFLDVAVAPAENCYPMIPAGCGHHEVMLREGQFHREAC
jgi:acetolactate synthase-1/2/3 large subunit